MHWFEKQTRDDQAMLLAFTLLDIDEHAGTPTPPVDPLAAHLARIERMKAKGGA